jgi:hypothetical protein
VTQQNEQVTASLLVPEVNVIALAIAHDNKGLS